MSVSFCLFCRQAVLCDRAIEYALSFRRNTNIRISNCIAMFLFLAITVKKLLACALHRFPVHDSPGWGNNKCEIGKQKPAHGRDHKSW